MEFVKSQFDRIQRQLNGLSASQKMLTAALVTIMVMTLAMWGRYAGEAEYKAVLDQPLQPDELSRIVTELTAKGIPNKVDGGRILVPEDRRLEALAHMSYGQMLPRDFANSFDEVAKSLNPFESKNVTDAKLNRAKEQTLAAIIGAFPGVKNAVVMIDANGKRQIGNDVEPSATVNIWMRNGGTTRGNGVQQLVNAAADTVAGSQAGLLPARIKVNVDGMPRKIQGSDVAGGPDSNEQLQAIQINEKYFEGKIREHFHFIPNLMVSVAVDLNFERSQALSEEFDPKRVVTVPLEEFTEETETKSAQPAAGEPGVRANGGMEVNAGNAPGGTGGSSTHSSTKTKNENRVSKTTTKTEKPAGAATPVSASVRVPRSYFVNVLKNGRSDAKEPDQNAIDALAKAELPKIREAVSRCATFKDPSAISVETYLDLGNGLQVVEAPETATASSVSFLVGGHAKEIALGGLAAVSLFMVSMMVRKSAPAPLVVAGPVVDSGPISLSAGEIVAGEVGGGDAMLDGMELSDDAVKTQQMLDQVSTMVNENPDAAAALVKRWMNK